MPNLPLPSQTDVTIQNQATGAIDFLKYEGSTLVASRMFDYGIGSDWKVVASLLLAGGAGLVVQSASTGLVDFLVLDAGGNLARSEMSSVAVPRMTGWTLGHNLVSQLPDGELDFLEFNNVTGALIASGGDAACGRSRLFQHDPTCFRGSQQRG
jgi:hypothetical protein